MKILFVENRIADKQYSMVKYGDMIRDKLASTNFEVEYLSAPFIFSIFKNKWAVYVDTMILLPILFFFKSRYKDLVFIPDHSNGYLLNVSCCKINVVVCHDMIAIRSAFDQNDIKLSYLGKFLQHSCFKGLQKATKVIAVSNTTKSQYDKYSQVNNCEVILSGLNENYKVFDKSYSIKILRKFNITSPFILHVGSNLERKNRDGIIKAFSISKFSQEGYLVFAGAKLNKKYIEQAKSLGCYEKIIDLGYVSFEELNALYSLSISFVFPSFSEGFGWPVIEAQASGTIVICSNLESLAEVGEKGTILINPYDASTIAEAIDVAYYDISIRDKIKHESVINLLRFSSETMKNDFVNLFWKLLK